MKDRHDVPDPEQAMNMHRRQGYTKVQRMRLFDLRLMAEELASEGTGKRRPPKGDQRARELIAHLEACFRLSSPGRDPS